MTTFRLSSFVDQANGEASRAIVTALKKVKGIDPNVDCAYSFEGEGEERRVVLSIQEPIDATRRTFSTIFMLKMPPNTDIDLEETVSTIVSNIPGLNAGTPLPEQTPRS